MVGSIQTAWHWVPFGNITVAGHSPFPQAVDPGFAARERNPFHYDAPYVLGRLWRPVAASFPASLNEAVTWLDGLIGALTRSGATDLRDQAVILQGILVEDQEPEDFQRNLLDSFFQTLEPALRYLDLVSDRPFEAASADTASADAWSHRELFRMVERTYGMSVHEIPSQGKGFHELIIDESVLSPNLKNLSQNLEIFFETIQDALQGSLRLVRRESGHLRILVPTFAFLENRFRELHPGRFDRFTFTHGESSADEIQDRHMKGQDIVDQPTRHVVWNDLTVRAVMPAFFMGWHDVYHVANKLLMAPETLTASDALYRTIKNLPETLRRHRCTKALLSFLTDLNGLAGMEPERFLIRVLFLIHADFLMDPTLSSERKMAVQSYSLLRSLERGWEEIRDENLFSLTIDDWEAARDAIRQHWSGFSKERFDAYRAWVDEVHLAAQRLPDSQKIEPLLTSLKTNLL